ncbi:PaaI family thioesterase [Burkholderia seminalis]|uniref:PaaI family thioesterase n=2 Tax=Burkholderia cepacia complex TaxID=87882 RepID=A0A8A8DG37_9BURK|nr:PaaI family thioesterase [Burkholderia seminalis]QTO23430.1 PaaI family thioesterase [Burkholderia seminalis]
MKPNPFIEMLGAKVEIWRDGYAEIVLPIVPSLLNTRGILHGGVTAALLDSVCGLAGLFDREEEKRRIGSTLSLTVSYLERGVGTHVVAKGYAQREGRSVFFSRGEVWTDRGVLIATGQGVFGHASVQA